MEQKQSTHRDSGGHKHNDCDDYKKKLYFSTGCHDNVKRADKSPCEGALKMQDMKTMDIVFVEHNSA